jgi:hypothetical protein
MGKREVHTGSCWGKMKESDELKQAVNACGAMME